MKFPFSIYVKNPKFTFLVIWLIQMQFFCTGICKAQNLPQSVDISLNTQGDQIKLEWDATQSGDRFLVEYSTDVNNDASWKTCPNLEGWPTTDEQFQIFTNPGENSKFFRIKATEDTPIERGKVIESTYLGYYSIPYQTGLLNYIGITSINPQYEIDIYQLVYETVSVEDYKTTASGLIAIPRVSNAALPIISYQHGTIIAKHNAPSVNVNSSERHIPMICASAGFIGIEADYLGLGESPGYHPYLHAKSEATAVIDLIQATRNFLLNRSIGHNGKLFLMGHSQGGHATVAAHKMLQLHHSLEFPVTASAPMSGLYMISDTIFATTDLDYDPVPASYAYLVHSYQRIYQIAPDWSDFINAPYDTMVPDLFDGYHDDEVVYGQFPHQFSLFITDSFEQEISGDEEDSYFYKVLVENDLLDWLPQAPIRLYHTLSDSIVPYSNATRAQTAFTDLGASNISVVDVNPQLDHGEAAIPSIESALIWFQSF